MDTNDLKNYFRYWDLLQIVLGICVEIKPIFVAKFLRGFLSNLCPRFFLEFRNSSSNLYRNSFIIFFNWIFFWIFLGVSKVLSEVFPVLLPGLLRIVHGISMEVLLKISAGVFMGSLQQYLLVFLICFHSFSLNSFPKYIHLKVR